MKILSISIQKFVNFVYYIIYLLNYIINQVGNSAPFKCEDPSIIPTLITNETHETDNSLVLAWFGLSSALICWPVVLLLHYTNTERVYFNQGVMPMLYMAVVGIVTAVYNLFLV